MTASPPSPPIIVTLPDDGAACADVTVFVDPLGVIHPLGTFGQDHDGQFGRFMPPMVTLETAIPGQPGSRLDDVQVNPREVTVPVLLIADTPVDVRRALRAFVRGLQPTLGDGLLRVTTVDGTVRQLTCRCTDGLQIEETWFKTRTGTAQAAALVFRAFDPYWYDENPTVETFTEEGFGIPFFPFFPMILGGSSISVTESIYNQGDVQAWPVWTITGPGSVLVLTNETTGLSLTIDAAIPAGRVWTIDTRPGHKTISDDLGVNLFPDLIVGSSLWPLVAGTNRVSVALAATTGAASVVLSYTNGWLTP